MKIVCVSILMLFLGRVAFAQSSGSWNGGPRWFSYQAQLQDQQGQPLNGTHSVLIALYDGGSSGSIIYEETHASVNFTNGVFDLNVGQYNQTAPELPESIKFNKQYWMAVTIDPGGLNEIKFPRQHILSAPYALNS